MHYPFSTHNPSIAGCSEVPVSITEQSVSGHEVVKMGTDNTNDADGNFWKGTVTNSVRIIIYCLGSKS